MTAVLQPYFSAAGTPLRKRQRVTDRH